MDMKKIMISTIELPSVEPAPPHSPSLTRTSTTSSTASFRTSRLSSVKSTKNKRNSSFKQQKSVDGNTLSSGANVRSVSGNSSISRADEADSIPMQNRADPQRPITLKSSFLRKKRKEYEGKNLELLCCCTLKMLRMVVKLCF